MVDVNEELLEAAREVLGTDSNSATINEALRECVRRQRAMEAIAVFNAVEMDFTGSGDAWGYGGGRDLSRLAEKAREGRSS